MMCVACSGSGTNTCSGCGERGSTQRLTVTGAMDISPCLVCGGRGRVPCQFCGGRGQVGTEPAPGLGAPPPPPRPGRSSGDPVEGRWNGPQGCWFEFVRDGSAYRVTEHGPLGQTGTGTATLQGGAVKLEGTNVLMGKYTVELRLVGDTLQGEFRVMGIPVPLNLHRG